MGRYDAAPRLRGPGDQVYIGPRPVMDTRPKSDDRFYTTRSGDRLTTVAYSFLGDAALWWVIADFNDILDPFEELAVGTELRIPSQSRYILEIEGV